jgi:hypothetical protein
MIVNLFKKSFELLNIIMIINKVDKMVNKFI